MIPAHGLPRIAVQCAATLALYRCLLAPAARWCAGRLGAGVFPAKALNGTHPERPARPADVLWVCLLLAPLTALACGYAHTPAGGVALLPPAALAILLWKHLTADYDAARELGWQRADRIAGGLLGVAALVWPALSYAAVIALCGRLGGWTHHSKACVRVVKVAFGWSLVGAGYDALAGPQPTDDTAGLLMLLGLVHLSHYVVPARTKVRLGPRPWSWVTRNRTEMLIAAAYARGWARLLPEPTAARLIGALAPFTVGLNAATLVVEGMGLVAYAHRWLLLAAVVGAVLFNLTVALTSGLLFWEHIALGALLAVLIVRAPAPVRAELCGPGPWLLSVAVLALVLCGVAWRPTELGWWDTPFTARVYWCARTRLGHTVGLYNDFMRPFDREYGRSVGNPLATEPLVTFAMGGVRDPGLRDRLLALGPDAEALHRLKSRYGTRRWDPDYQARHGQYLTRLVARINAGVAKSPLPRALRWLRAPGSHYYYWGDLPGYRPHHGPLTAVQVRYREVYFHAASGTFVRLRDEALLDLPIPPADGAPPAGLDRPEPEGR
ncbi:hypothetical protein ACFVFQ_00165 [Streptomyces sp. NPDC057743]|uniref:hypothetical protein n=1 Tax=Streptomyces sp. NPDC057743 TaxID=3346236 RepID=UPI0036B5404E